MIQLYSTGCMYALRALMHVGQDAHAAPFTARDVCRKAGIPESFTRKIFQSMVRGGFLRAVPGPGGGYRLLKRPKDIPVLRVIEAVDGKEAFQQCVLHFNECNHRKPCALHESWVESKKKLLQELEAKTIQDLMASTLEKKG